MVRKTYNTTKRNIPGKNCFTSARRSDLFIGCLSVRSAISSASGGGIFSIRYTVKHSNGKNTAPATKGIHISGTLKLSIRYCPTDLTTPEEKIKLTASAAPIKSVVFLPSIYENTTPHNNPRGNPLRNKNTIL